MLHVSRCLFARLDALCGMNVYVQCLRHIVLKVNCQRRFGQPGNTRIGFRLFQFYVLLLRSLQEPADSNPLCILHHMFPALVARPSDLKETLVPPDPSMLAGEF